MPVYKKKLILAEEKKKKEIKLKMRETGKEKVQKYKKWPSQKESIW